MKWPQLSMEGSARTIVAVLILLAHTHVVRPANGQDVDPAPGTPDFETRELATGVYALLPTRQLLANSGLAVVANSGFVVGERGVLFIDALSNAGVARTAQAVVRQVTDKPILYLVNTNYHGDHTFGNYAFPEGTTIIAHRGTAERLQEPTYLSHEKQVLVGLGLMSDSTAVADVQVRLPDIVFDDYLRLDLGGQAVELRHFGPAQTPGDVVVYVPEARVAWGGNFVFGADSIPFLFEGGGENYLLAVSRLASTLEVETIVTGHFSVTSDAIFGRYLDYLSTLVGSVRKAVHAGKTLDETAESLSLPERFDPATNLRSFWRFIHAHNVRQTYWEVANQ